MKSIVCVFLLVLLFPNKIYAQDVVVTNSRKDLIYEIRDINIENEILSINGWAFNGIDQHYLNNNTHDIYIILISGKEELKYKATLMDTNLTDIMDYRGYSTCPNNSIGQKECNYFFKNVGFRVQIPMQQLDKENYNFYIEVHSKQSKNWYRSKLYYPFNYNLNFDTEDKKYTLTSNFKYIDLTVLHQNFVVRKGPSPKDELMYLGNSCSASYENQAYFTHNGTFTDIKSIHSYSNVVTYYEVGVQRYSKCIENRVRVIEDLTTNSTKGFIPSTAVNFSGVALSLHIVKKYKPEIKAKDITIRQYSDYDPRKYVNAKDRYNKSISANNMNITSNVNTSVPKEYSTCYSYDKENLKTCSKVNVVKVPVRLRYVSSSSYNWIDKISIWMKTKYRSTLLDILNIKG